MLQWERMPSLTHGRAHHACCAVKGGVVVLGVSVLATPSTSKSKQTKSKRTFRSSFSLPYFSPAVNNVVPSGPRRIKKRAKIPEASKNEHRPWLTFGNAQQRSGARPRLALGNATHERNLRRPMAAVVQDLFTTRELLKRTRNTEGRLGVSRRVFHAGGRGWRISAIPTVTFCWTFPRGGEC